MEFQHGKIYTIRSHQTNKYYIGSTNQLTLAQRLGKHRRNYKKYLINNTKGYISSFEILKYNDYYIELLLAYPCNSRDELHRREGELIRQYKSDLVNICIAGRTDKEYYEDNKTHLLEQKKQTILCNCGIVITKYYLSKHLRLNIHTTNINNLYLNELNYYIL
jgi:hypothetical protein